MANQGSSFVAKLQEKLEYPCVGALNLHLVRDFGAIFLNQGWFLGRWFGISRVFPDQVLFLRSWFGI